MERRTSFFSTILTTVCLSTLVFNSFSQGMVYLDANNVKAGFYPGGNLFSEMVNGAIDKASYEVPKGSGIHSIYASSFWLSALDQAGNLKGAVARYQQPTDWDAGPISTTYDALYDSIYRRVFKVSKVEIDFHRLNFGSLGYTMPNSIKSWPGNGRLAFGESAQLAPFEDKNQNGVYEPALGEYPSICGDQAVFFILNDMRSPLQNSDCQKMGVEMQILAYVINGTDSVLNNTVFLSVKVSNKSSSNYNSVYFSSFLDPDLGCFSNDRIGCDTASNSFYAYNGTANDLNGCLTGLLGYRTTSAVQGLTFLNQRLDEFNYFANATGPSSFPQTCSEYRSFQSGLFKDGTAIHYGGNGYGSSGPVTKYCFPGNPMDPTQWSEINQQSGAAIPPGDRRMLGSIFIDTLNANASIRVDMALVNTLKSNVTPFEAVPLFLQDVQHVRSVYQMQLANCRATISGIPNSQEELSTIDLFPNPTTGKLTIEFNTTHNSSTVSLMDIEGRELLKTDVTTPSTNLDLSGFSKGVYLIKVQSGKNATVKRVIVE
jgi:hypothetical protein